MEYLFTRLAGVVKTEVGYIDGSINYPSYEQVCAGSSGYYEAVRIIYDPKHIDYPSIIKYFFEIHDPGQAHGQGPDYGYQYQSAIFYYNNEQYDIASCLIKRLVMKNILVTTKLSPMQIFRCAEEYHQAYYAKHQQTPYCHRYTKRF